MSWEYFSGSVRATSVKVPYFGDWMINFMNDSNRNLCITCSNQHFWSFLSGCLSNDWWHVFFFEIGRDVEGIEVLEVLSWRILGAGPQVGKGRFFKDSIHPHVDQYRKSRVLMIVTRIVVWFLIKSPEIYAFEARREPVLFCVVLYLLCVCIILYAKSFRWSSLVIDSTHRYSH